MDCYDCNYKLTSSGTGFLFNFKDLISGDFICIITNKHVIKDAASVSIMLTMINNDNNIVKDKIKLDSRKYNIEIIEYNHPDDVDLVAINFIPFLKTAIEIINKKWA